MNDPQTVSMVAILLSAALTDNILLTRFLGMCPFLAVSRQMKAFSMDHGRNGARSKVRFAQIA